VFLVDLSDLQLARGIMKYWNNLFQIVSFAADFRLDMSKACALIYFWVVRPIAAIHAMNSLEDTDDSQKMGY
jgi:hypothetical protein